MPGLRVNFRHMRGGQRKGSACVPHARAKATSSKKPSTFFARPSRTTGAPACALLSQENGTAALAGEKPVWGHRPSGPPLAGKTMPSFPMRKRSAPLPTPCRLGMKGMGEASGPCFRSAPGRWYPSSHGKGTFNMPPLSPAMLRSARKRRPENSPGAGKRPGRGYSRPACRRPERPGEGHAARPGPLPAPCSHRKTARPPSRERSTCDGHRAPGPPSQPPPRGKNNAPPFPCANALRPFPRPDAAT